MTEKAQAGGFLFMADRTGRVLLLKRSKFCDSPHTWSIPGGGFKPDTDDTIFETAKRETFEEIGLTVENTASKVFKIYEHASPDLVFTTYMALCEDEFVPRLNHEHTGYRWVNLVDLPSPLHTGMLPMIRNTSPLLANLMKVLNVKKDLPHRNRRRTRRGH